MNIELWNACHCLINGTKKARVNYCAATTRANIVGIISEEQTGRPDPTTILLVAPGIDFTNINMDIKEENMGEEPEAPQEEMDPHPREHTSVSFQIPIYHLHTSFCVSAPSPCKL
jgi:hypothetical protein